jgi:hypothetical protein
VVFGCSSRSTIKSRERDNAHQTGPTARDLTTLRWKPMRGMRCMACFQAVSNSLFGRLKQIPDVVSKSSASSVASAKQHVRHAQPRNTAIRNAWRAGAKPILGRGVTDLVAVHDFRASRLPVEIFELGGVNCRIESQTSQNQVWSSSSDDLMEYSVAANSVILCSQRSQIRSN